MIYYNLESEYPGDITKHCGLTVDEVDRNFYELETKINSIEPCDCKPEQRFWSYSTKGVYPESNTIETRMLGENTCFVSGVVSEGEMMFGIDSPELYGVSLVLDGEAYIDNNRVPNKMLLCCYPSMNSVFGFRTVVSEYGDELDFEIGDGITYDDAPHIVTSNRKLDVEFRYNGKSIVSGRFVFDENLVVEEYRPLVWLDKTIWRDKDVWIDGDDNNLW